MRIKGILFVGFCFVFGLVASNSLNAKMPKQSGLNEVELLAKGGGDDEEKKAKKEGKDKKSKKDDSMKDAKTSNASSKPSQHARNSAKEAKYSQKMAQKQIMNRAKVRNFFHSMFNTKYGKPVNFRSTRRRNRWSRGR